MNRKNRKYLLNKLQEIKLYLILHTLVTDRFVFSFKRQKVKHPQCIKHPQWIKSIYSIINESQKAVYVTSSTVGCTWVVINHSTWQTIPGILLHCSFGINIYYPTYIYMNRVLLLQKDMKEECACMSIRPCTFLWVSTCASSSTVLYNLQ